MRAHINHAYAHTHTCVHMLHKIDNETEGGILFGLYTNEKENRNESLWWWSIQKCFFFHSKWMQKKCLICFFYFQFAGLWIIKDNTKKKNTKMLQFLIKKIIIN